MSRVEISITDHIWAVSLYTRELLSVEVYRFLRRLIKPDKKKSPKIPALIQVSRYEKKMFTTAQELEFGDPIRNAPTFVIRILDFLPEAPAPPRVPAPHPHQMPSLKEVYTHCFDGCPLIDDLSLDKSTKTESHASLSGQRYKKSNADFSKLMEDLQIENSNLEAVNENFHKKIDYALKLLPETASDDDKCAMLNKVLAGQAAKFGILSGHWSCYFPTETVPEKIEVEFGKINRGFLFGPLQSSPATAICLKKTMDGYAISIRNPLTTCLHENGGPDRDFQTFKIEKAIRKSRLIRQLKYKPDIISACEIYHMNQEIMRPTVYRSIYDSELKRSEITPHKDGSKVQFKTEDTAWINHYDD